MYYGYMREVKGMKAITVQTLSLIHISWMSQNKVQPGVYINTKSSGNLSASVGEKGVVAIAEPLSWGPCEVIQTIIPGEDLTPYIGYDVTSEKAMFLREMMKGSDTTPGPIKILLYRPKMCIRDSF